MSKKKVRRGSNPKGSTEKVDDDSGRKSAEKPGGVVLGAIVEKKAWKTKGKKWTEKGNKTEKPNSTVKKLPMTKDDFSANWKKLSETLKTNYRGHKKPDLKRPLPKKRIVVDDAGGSDKAGKADLPKNEPKAPEIWFDGVDPELLRVEDKKTPLPLKPSDGGSSAPLVKGRSFAGLTKAVAMDCEMVGVGPGGADSVLARVSLVNLFGHCIYDKFVKPREPVTDFRTKVSGIRPSDLKHAHEFLEVQREVHQIIKDRLLVGHAIRHDLKVLFLDHPRSKVRDTSTYKPFRSAFGGRTPSLKNLTLRMLGVTVQDGEHSSVQDAQAAMRLYTMFKRDWESSIKDPKRRKPISNAKEGPTGPKGNNAAQPLLKRGPQREQYVDSD